MDVSLFNAPEEEPRLKVSIPIRLIAVFSCLLPVVGVVVSSKLVLEMFVALSADESAGTAEVTEIMTRASFIAVGPLYLAIVSGLVMIVILVRRIFVRTRTASPPVWFFGAAGVLYLLPTWLYWKAHLLVLEALSPNSSIPSNEMGITGAYIAELLLWSIVAAVIVSISMLVLAFVPFKSRSDTTQMSLIGATAIEVLLIGTAIVVQLR
ncbi:MAG: hypothetical protein IPM63_13545 [Acidobacteriota bacterium]|nr:MAG: hypothetical protein IPM63_13545 [Acidobacteriota bacterium]